MDSKENERISAQLEKVNKIQSQLIFLERKAHQKKVFKMLALFACFAALIIPLALLFSPHSIVGFYLTVTLNSVFLLIVVGVLSLDTFSDSIKERESAVNTLKMDVVREDIRSLQTKYSELEQKYSEIERKNIA